MQECGVLSVLDKRWSMTWEYSALRRDFEYTKARIQTKRERLVSVSLRIEQLLAEQRELELCIGKSGEHLQELSDREGPEFPGSIPPAPAPTTQEHEMCLWR